MFDWFWKALYGISKTLYKVCDLLMSVAFKLCGVEDIVFNGEEMDFITYLISLDAVQFAYMAISIMGFIILVIFTIIAILRSIAKSGETDCMSPKQICIKAFKCVLMFMFVPGMLIIFTYFINVLFKQIYIATSYGANSIGAFLFVSFADDCGLSDADKTSFLTGALDYRSTSDVWNAVNLKEYSFVTSWITAFVVMYFLSAVEIQFVDRAIEIVIIFIAAPFSIGSSVLDEGARFKVWRDQLISKYLGAFGALVAINIYCLVISGVIDESFYFFDNPVFNNVAKILIILGGASTMRKAQATVGALISQTAAADQRDPAFAGNALKSALGSAIAHSPIGYVGSAIGEGIQNRLNEGKEAIQRKLGLRDPKQGGGGGGGGGAKEGEQNENKPEGFNDQQSLNNALEGGDQTQNPEGGGDDKKSESDNQNSNQSNNNQGNNMVQNAMQGNEQPQQNNNEGEQ